MEATTSNYCTYTTVMLASTADRFPEALVQRPLTNQPYFENMAQGAFDEGKLTAATSFIQP